MSPHKQLVLVRSTPHNKTAPYKKPPLLGNNTNPTINLDGDSISHLIKKTIVGSNPEQLVGLLLTTKASTYNQHLYEKLKECKGFLKRLWGGVFYSGRSKGRNRRLPPSYK